MTDLQSKIPAEAEMKVSIIICTRNRSSSLEETLKCIGKSAVPLDWKIELLVVDNGSTDSTKIVSLSTCLQNNLPVRYIWEPRKGKGHAYNAGMAAAYGKIFLFTDDDIRVPRNWVEGMVKPILDGLAHAVQGGIKIAPHLDRPWLTGSLRIWVAAVEDPSHPPAGLVGANMAFGRQALAVTGGFDLRLGPGAAGFFDDTVFGWAIQRAGLKILYQPSIAVEHHFDPARLTLRSYINSAHRMAASHAIVKRDLNPTGFRPTIFALIKQLPGLAIRCITQMVRFFVNRHPDPGFVMRYYELLLWRALRKQIK